MGRLGIAVAVIVWLFYMSMIYGSAAMALAGFALIFFMIFSYVERAGIKNVFIPYDNREAKGEMERFSASENRSLSIGASAAEPDHNSVCTA